MAVAGFVLHRRAKLFFLTEWMSELSSFALFKAVILLEIGAGVMIFAYLVSKYQQQSSK
jgi:hypothetical protein